MPIDFSGNDKLTLVGPGLGRLTERQREVLTRLVGYFAGGTEVSIAVDSGIESKQDMAQVIPVTREDLHDFAIDHGYTAQRAQRAWRAIIDSATGARVVGDAARFPAVTIVDSEGGYPAAVDIGSVGRRLMATQGSSFYWPGAGPRTLEFIEAVYRSAVERTQLSDD